MFIRLFTTTTIGILITVVLFVEREGKPYLIIITC